MRENIDSTIGLKNRGFREGDVVRTPLGEEKRVGLITRAGLVFLEQEGAVYDPLALTLLRRPVREGDRLYSLAFGSCIVARQDHLLEARRDRAYFSRFVHENRVPIEPCGPEEEPALADPSRPETRLVCFRCKGLFLPKHGWHWVHDDVRVFCSDRCADLSSQGQRAIVPLGPALFRAGMETLVRGYGGKEWLDVPLPNLTAVDTALRHFISDLYCLGVDAFPFWRTDPEVRAAVESVADHRIGARVSNGRLARAYVRAWREDWFGLRTQWMGRAWRAQNWRKG